MRSAVTHFVACNLPFSEYEVTLALFGLTEALCLFSACYQKTGSAQVHCCVAQPYCLLAKAGKTCTESHHAKRQSFLRESDMYHGIC